MFFAQVFRGTQSVRDNEHIVISALFGHLNHGEIQHRDFTIGQARLRQLIPLMLLLNGNISKLHQTMQKVVERGIKQKIFAILLQRSMQKMVFRGRQRIEWGDTQQKHHTIQFTMQQTPNHCVLESASKRYRGNMLLYKFVS